MKRTTLVVLGLIVCTVLMANSSFQEMWDAYEQMQNKQMSFNNRIDYTYFITVFLPPNYSSVIFANEYLYQEQIYYEWDEAWLQAIQFEFTYSNNLVIQQLMTMGEYVYQYDITYDANDRLYQVIMSIDTGSGFNNFMRETFEFNANGVLNSYLAEFWQVTNGEWINGVQWLITLDGDHILTILSQNWDAGDEAWEENERINLTWDGDHITENLREQWEDGAWINEQLRVYTYSNYNVIEILEQEWDGSGWENNEYIELTWENGVITYQLYQEWDGSNWIIEWDNTTTYENGNPVEDLRMNWTGSEWINDSKIDYIYDMGTSPNYISNTPIQLTNYPNPFNPETTISFETTNLHENTRIEIYNLKGQLIHSQEFQSRDHSFVWNGTDKDGNSITSGVYFYILSLDGKTAKVRKCLLLK